jgi:uncharacterized protein YbjT (DUF2867 family)
MTPGKSIALLGATGLVGGHCLHLLLEDPAFQRVVVASRRPLGPAPRSLAPPGKLEEHVLDFARLAEVEVDEWLRVDAVLCALGTTLRQAGSQQRFREVDLGIPLALARRAVELGVLHFLLVSSVGASASSWFFYNRVKGELEDAVLALPFRSVTIARPSLLLGDRGERRPGEEVGKRLAFLVPGRYKPVEASAVARVLVSAAREDRPGRRIYESEEIRAESQAAGAP